MLTRPSDLSLTQTTSTSSSEPLTVAPCSKPPIVGAEDTEETGMAAEDKSRMASYERPDNDRRAVEKSRKGTEEQGEVLQEQLKAERDSHQKQDAGFGNGRQEEEEEEEMTQEKLQSLLEDINLEGGLEDVEMTEEGVKAILEQVRQAEKDLCSVPGWRSETSAGVAESAAPGHSPDAEEGR